MHSSTASCTNHAACLPDNHGGSSTASALACVAVCCTTLCPPSASARRGCDVDQSTAAFSRRLIGGPLSRRAVVEDSWSTDAVSLVLWWGQPRELTRAALKGSLNEIAEGPLAARPCWSAHRRLAWRQRGDGARRCQFGLPLCALSRRSLLVPPARCTPPPRQGALPRVKRRLRSARGAILEACVDCASPHLRHRVAVEGFSMFTDPLRPARRTSERGRGAAMRLRVRSTVGTPPHPTPSCACRSPLRLYRVDLSRRWHCRGLGRGG